MPALDHAIATMARVGMFDLHIGAEPPLRPVLSPRPHADVWLKPAVPSWSAEGTLYLWDEGAGAYSEASPTLWRALFHKLSP